MKKTLLEAIQDTISSGNTVLFWSEAFMLYIEIKNNKKRKNDVQCMPLQDHFTEEKLAGCIEYMNNKLNS